MESKAAIGVARCGGSLLRCQSSTYFMPHMLARDLLCCISKQLIGLDGKLGEASAMPKSQHLRTEGTENAKSPFCTRS